MDFRLNVFISVARNLNFTKAAKELHISQPAISKHIHELESIYNIQLFERCGNKVILTSTGETFLKHAETIISNYKALQLEMNLITGNFIGELRVGASTTIAQYVLPPILASFINRFPDIRLYVLTGNSVQIEQALEEHKIDIGLVEGDSRKYNLKYTHFTKDELVLVTHIQNKIKDEITIEELSKLPLVLRESGSGTLEVIENALFSHKFKLSQMNILLQLGSTESIKLFLENSPFVLAIISIAAVYKELVNNKLKIIEVIDLNLNREFSFVEAQGSHNDIVDKFKQFLINQL